jgi:hypothetical protein
MRGKIRAKPIHNKPLTGAVGGGDQVVLALELEPDVPASKVAH